VRCTELLFKFFISFCSYYREQFLPPVDPDNEQFVIYVRSKKGLKTWFPLNVVTGGSTANTLVKGLDSNLSKEV
jgi:hypothetical protein